MKIHDIGYNHAHDGNFIIDRPNGCGSWLLLIIKSPSVFKTADTHNTETYVSENSFVLFEPFYPHYYKAYDNVYKDDWCHFDLDPADTELLNTVNLPYNIITDIKDSSDLSALMRTMCFEFYSLNPYKNKTIDLCFHQLIYKLSERITFMQPPTNITKGVYFDKFLWIRECIYRNPGNNWSIDDFAKFLSVSRSRFQHLYTQTFGISIMQDIISGRIEFACSLLKTTDLSINEISKMSGYNNPAYFMGKFKEKMGTTPSLYRNSNDSLRTNSSFFNDSFIL